MQKSNDDNIAHGITITKEDLKLFHLAHFGEELPEINFDGDEPKEETKETEAQKSVQIHDLVNDYYNLKPGRDDVPLNKQQEEYLRFRAEHRRQFLETSTDPAVSRRHLQASTEESEHETLDY